MNRLVYDVCMLAGLSLVTSGVAVMFGLGPALIAAGAGLVGLTAFGATMGGKR